MANQDHPNLRPIANTLLAWAAATRAGHPGVQKLRITAQQTLRLEAHIGERLKAVKVRDGDFVGPQNG